MAKPSQEWFDRGSGTATPLAPPPASAADEAMVLQVVQALGRIGTGAVDAEGHLVELMEDPRDNVRSAVLMAVRCIRGEATVADD